MERLQEKDNTIQVMGTDDDAVVSNSTLIDNTFGLCASFPAREKYLKQGTQVWVYKKSEPT